MNTEQKQLEIEFPNLADLVNRALTSIRVRVGELTTSYFNITPHLQDPLGEFNIYRRGIKDDIADVLVVLKECAKIVHNKARAKGLESIIVMIEDGLEEGYGGIMWFQGGIVKLDEIYHTMRDYLKDVSELIIAEQKTASELINSDRLEDPHYYPFSSSHLCPVDRGLTNGFPLTDLSEFVRQIVKVQDN